MSFGSRLRAAMDEHGPLCAGIDPHPALLQQWGHSDDVDGLRAFTHTCVEAFAGQVAAVKPQSAFFERHGAAGIGVLEAAVRDLRAAGTLVILDVKRGDIGSTAQGYADAYLKPASPLCADAMTVSPYLGVGSLNPMFDTALANDAGAFVLALTSNPEGAEVQGARAASGRTVAGDVLAALRQRNGDAAPLGSLGAVVGATIGDTGEDLDIGGPLLVPGLGAQGGTVDDVRRIFGSSVRNVLASSSRDILSAGPSPEALREAALRTADELSALIW